MVLSNLHKKYKIFILSLTFIFASALIISFSLNIFLEKINTSYIKQNLALAGELSKIDGVNIDKVVNIITSSDLESIDSGREVLSRYGYDENISYTLNSRLGGEIKWITNSIVILSAMLFLILFTYLYVNINSLYKGIKRLRFKAEMIIEEKNYKENYNFKKDSELENLDMQFNLMKKRVDSSIDRLYEEKVNLKNIINDISHQLKTPLAAMSVYNQILLEHRNMNSEELDKFLLATKGQLNRIDFLVKTLLKYARLESNVVTYDKKERSINLTLKECINTLSAKAEGKNIKVVLNEECDINFRHDKSWLEEAFINIIKNAIEHSDYNSKVEIGLIQSDIFIRVEIRDYGKGIKESDISKIFNRFHKGSNNKNPESIGIGLALTKKIIEDHNGDITVRSKAGEGSSFLITFHK